MVPFDANPPPAKRGPEVRVDPFRQELAFLLATSWAELAAGDWGLPIFGLLDALSPRACRDAVTFCTYSPVRSTDWMSISVRAFVLVLKDVCFDFKLAWSSRKAMLPDWDV